MLLGELGLQLDDLKSAREMVGYAKTDNVIGVKAVLKALADAGVPFGLRRDMDAEGSWKRILEKTWGVYLIHASMDDGKTHVLTWDAARRLLLLAAAKDGRNNVGHTLVVEDEDLVSHENTKKKLKAAHGIVSPRFIYLVVVKKSRVADTLYGRKRRPGEHLGKKKGLSKA